MDLETFEAEREDLNLMCEELLGTKGADYTVGVDRLDNFKRVAAMVGVTPLQVWAIYFLKHVIAITKYVRVGNLADEPIVGRFADARNYLDLGYALVQESEGD